VIPRKRLKNGLLLPRLRRHIQAEALAVAQHDDGYRLANLHRIQGIGVVADVRDLGPGEFNNDFIRAV
jgi:hypothetical protein